MAGGVLVSDAHSGKAALRAQLRAERATLPTPLRDQETATTVAAVQAWLATQPPPALAGYVAIRNELDVMPLFTARWVAKERVFLPRIVNEDLVWHPVRSRDELHDGAYHIPEPDARRVHAAVPPPGTVALVPGVGFGADGRRLGQGGGYFDRWLARTHGIITIGIGFSCQRCDDLPVEDHDHDCVGVLLGGVWIKKPIIGPQSFVGPKS